MAAHRRHQLTYGRHRRLTHVRARRAVVALAAVWSLMTSPAT